MPQLQSDQEGTMPYILTTFDIIQDVSYQKILYALKSMPINKAPGVDGFPVEFLTNQWTTIKDYVLKSVREFFFQSGKMLKSFSCTTITLILKCDNSTKVKDYGPISYSNTFYKLI